MINLLASRQLWNRETNAEPSSSFPPPLLSRSFSHQQNLTECGIANISWGGPDGPGIVSFKADLYRIEG